MDARGRRPFVSHCPVLRRGSPASQVGTGDALFSTNSYRKLKEQHQFVKRCQQSFCHSEISVIPKVEQTLFISPSCPSPVRPSWRNYPTGSCHQEAQSLGRAADQSDLSLDLSELAEHFSLRAFFCVCCQPLFFYGADCYLCKHLTRLADSQDLIALFQPVQTILDLLIEGHINHHC